MSISKTVVQALEVVWVGIDVSKKKLDAAIWVGGKKYQTITVTNNAGGWAALLAWAKKVAGQDIELKFCMESTGDYHYEVGLYLTELEFHVSEVNPARIRFFGLEQGRLTKTDKADAKLIAQFGRERTPEAWAMRNPVRRNFFRLHRRRQQLMKMISMEDSRRECPQAIGQTCLRSIKIILKALRAELRAVEKDLAGIIQGDPILKHQSELIRSIPILEQASAILLLAEMPVHFQEVWNKAIRLGADESLRPPLGSPRTLHGDPNRNPNHARAQRHVRSPAAARQNPPSSDGGVHSQTAHDRLRRPQARKALPEPLAGQGQPGRLIRALA